MTRASGLVWAPQIPNHWDVVPLNYVAKMGTGHTPDRNKSDYWQNCSIPWVTTPDVTRRPDSLAPLLETEQHISELGMANSAAVLHPANTVMLSRTASIGYSVLIGRPMATTQAFVTWTAGATLDARYLLLVLRAMDPEWRRLAYGSTHLTIYMPDLETIRIPLPPLEEQRRIADFLGTETARIDQLLALRFQQSAILSSRLSQIIDGATAANVDALNAIGISASVENWRMSKLSRLCEIVPGYAFPSSGFLTDGTGVRLLRGINVAPSAISWREVVGWDVDSFPVPDRFHLRAGDLVVGMDRPWISEGARVSLVSEMDLPALLLQRVACLRPRGPIVMPYAYWALSSTHFRLSVESEMTGVSVPHLSGEQIGRFAFHLPPSGLQLRISDALACEAEQTNQLKAAISRQVDLLAERRRALITAAVTGQIDVSTASGRGIED
ncbi:restriction endonuclease subunit S [Micromonospora sp. NPDC047187]|uniref:restriction endonuclease subunit S n=1 Tax=Micromonospora sp. NPDC047187 TaxID=3155262 RepID=UPI0033DC1A24